MGNVIGHALSMIVGFAIAIIAGVTTTFIYEKAEKVLNNE